MVIWRCLVVIGDAQLCESTMNNDTNQIQMC